MSTDQPHVDFADGTTPDADLQVEGSPAPRSSGSREEPPRDTSEETGLVSPGSTADGAGTTT